MNTSNFGIKLSILAFVICCCYCQNGITVVLETNLKSADKTTTGHFLKGFEKNMKKVIINNNLHEDDFGEVIRNITSIDNMFVINYTTEKGFDKCTQAIALTQKAVNDVKQIARAKLICGPMEAVDFHK